MSHLSIKIALGNLFSVHLSMLLESFKFKTIWAQIVYFSKSVESKVKIQVQEFYTGLYLATQQEDNSVLSNGVSFLDINLLIIIIET